MDLFVTERKKRNPQTLCPPWKEFDTPDCTTLWSSNHQMSFNESLSRWHYCLYIVYTHGPVQVIYLDFAYRTGLNRTGFPHSSQWFVCSNHYISIHLIQSAKSREITFGSWKLDMIYILFIKVKWRVNVLYFTNTCIVMDCSHCIPLFTVVEAAEGVTAHNNVWNRVNGMESNTWKPWKPYVWCIWYHSTNSAPANTKIMCSPIKVTPTSCGLQSSWQCRLHTTQCQNYTNMQYWYDS
jgi:hypothetical protein